VGVAFGNLLGGSIGDRLSIWSPAHGRALTAQMSIFLGLIMATILFLVIPPSASLGLPFGIVYFLMGLVDSCIRLQSTNIYPDRACRQQSVRTCMGPCSGGGHFFSSRAKLCGASLTALVWLQTDQDVSESYVAGGTTSERTSLGSLSGTLSHTSVVLVPYLL